MINSSIYIILTIIFGFISLVSLAVVLKIIWPYKDELADRFEEENTSGDKTEMLKHVILENRLKRKLSDISVGKLRFLMNFIRYIARVFQKIYSQILEKEKSYRILFERMKLEKKGYKEKQEIVEKKLEEISETQSGSDEDKEDIEQKYLEVLAIDPKNIEAYEGLGEYYFQVGNINDAQEVYEYLIKLVPDKIDYYLGLYKCLEYQGSWKEAHNILERAYKIEPKNPKIIDKLIQIAIMMNDKAIAKKYLKDLKTVNPENKKIDEYRERIKQIKNK